MPNKIYACKTCDKQFSNKNSLGGHSSSHSRYVGMTLKARGLSYQCLNCDKDVTDLARRSRKRLYCDRECMVAYNDKNTVVFGVTRKAINEYKLKQEVCEICGLKERAIHASNYSRVSKLSVDHDHKTGKFRGLLCSSCNRNLGWAENNLSQIRKYLSKDNGL